ncbi:hypothetical protein J1614_010636 [Plenodomus biglobosus]|nr:hypothetical protein J1614_010636 [Plenodomus biglobosus]
MSEVHQHGNKSKNDAPHPIITMPNDHQTEYRFSSEITFSLQDRSCRDINPPTTYVVEEELQTQNLPAVPQNKPQHPPICEVASNMHIIRVEGLQGEYNQDQDSDISDCSCQNGKSTPLTGAKHPTKLYSAASSAKDLAVLANGDTSSDQDLVNLSAEARMTSGSCLLR